jgi:hypothetical protein
MPDYMVSDQFMGFSGSPDPSQTIKFTSFSFIIDEVAVRIVDGLIVDLCTVAPSPFSMSFLTSMPLLCRWFLLVLTMYRRQAIFP